MSGERLYKNFSDDTFQKTMEDIKKTGISININIINTVLCPRAGLSLQMQAPRLQFCPKAGLPLGINRCDSFPLLSAPHSLASEQTLKDLKRSQGPQRGGEESEFG